MDKPFIFGVPVEDSHFIGREDEINRLATNFKYGVNTILISPRRWGKTSLVNKVAGLVSSKQLLVVKMDIFSCRNEYDFYNNKKENNLFIFNGLFVIKQDKEHEPFHLDAPNIFH